MEKMTQLYEGKAKKVYATEDPAVVIVSYKDDATALDGLKKGTIAGKGVVNNPFLSFPVGKLKSVLQYSWFSSIIVFVSCVKRRLYHLPDRNQKTGKSPRR